MKRFRTAVCGWTCTIISTDETRMHINAATVSSMGFIYRQFIAIQTSFSKDHKICLSKLNQAIFKQGVLVQLLPLFHLCNPLKQYSLPICCMHHPRKVSAWFWCMFFPLYLSQVPSPGAAVLVSGLTAHPVWLHSWSSSQAAALLPQLHRDHAQRCRRGQTGHPGVSAPVPRSQMELHDHKGQPGHLRPCAGQR